MIEALARFVDALRAEKVAVSPAEIVDAGRALDLVGWERRTDVRSALRATLAKDRRSAQTFDRLFDRFFAPPRFPVAGEGVGRDATAARRPRPGDRDGDKPKHQKPKEHEAHRGKTSPEAEREAPSLSEILDRATGRAERPHGRLRRAKLRRARADAPDVTRRDLANRMTTEEERELAREIPRLVEALKLRVGRRSASARSGRPWLRRALRDNLKHGGIPFVIPYRAPKRKSTRVVLLVDVSFSVARAAGLFLLMAAAFVELGRRARVLAFVDRPVDATAAVAGWARGKPCRPDRSKESRAPRRRDAPPGAGIGSGSVSFADVLHGISDLNLEAPSDYGRAFHALRSSRLAPRGRDTVLVILGDGRTNRFDALPWALSELARGCRAVLWLVAEPRSRWGTADSALADYLPSVDLVVEANDLDGLAKGLGELVRRL
jgi:uncharacterized protein with von Willebrand factor type A (vWA) domain